ncbi:hypothetical protein IFR05_011132 [Cadophora sp. M221]|nr:hypothetical protein IFR05_011132 [Cadophora sp. M221]
MAILSLAAALGLLASTASSAHLKVLKMGTTVDGTTLPVRGWNSWGLQAAGYIEAYDEIHVRAQCDQMYSTLQGKYKLCGLDSGWSRDGGDKNGIIQYDGEKFDLPSLAKHLHSKGGLLGVYVVPGAFVSDYDKTVKGTNTKIRDICHHEYGFVRCALRYDHPDTQKWFDSNAAQFAAWGVDYIKLDFITPGSPEHGDVNLVDDSSSEVIGWHRAIQKTGCKITLQVSWKLDRSRKYFDIWRANADSMRIDQDVNNYANKTPLVKWTDIQRDINNYRDWAVTALSFYDTANIHPNMDMMFVANGPEISGLTEDQRKTIFYHWIGASAELNLGSDLTKMDTFGIALLTHPRLLSAASFTGRYPMQPRNPGTGGNAPQQLQAWISGPAPSGELELIVVLANYGPDEGAGGYGTGVTGTQTVTARWRDLGVEGAGYRCEDVYSGEAVSSRSGVSARLAPYQSVMYRCTK